MEEENNKAASEVPGIVKKGMYKDLAETLIPSQGIQQYSGDFSGTSQVLTQAWSNSLYVDVYIQCSNVALVFITWWSWASILSVLNLSFLHHDREIIIHYWMMEELEKTF